MNNIPTLRFPEFKDEWVETTLEEISEIVGGGTPDTTIDEYWNGHINWFTPTELKSKYVSESLRKISTEGLKQSSSKILPKGTLLFSSRATVGDVSIALKECTTNQGFQSFIVNDKSINEFVYYWININKSSFLIKASGSTFLEINKTEIKKIAISIPSLPEQQKIASFLTSIDKRIQQLTRKKKLLEQYKKGVMQKIFSREIKFRDDKGNDFPDWEYLSLGNLGTTYNGLTGKTKEDFGSGYPYITYKQIFDNSIIDVSKFAFVELAGDENQNKAIYGDVFFTTSSETPKEVGFASVLMDSIEDLYLNSFCFGYRIKSFEILSPSFAQHLFRNQHFRNDVEKLAQGSTRYNMSKTELMKIEINLPTLPEQNKIATFLSSIDKKIALVNTQLEKTQNWKKGLLQKMFV